MTLFLARRVVDGVVDETTTIYLGRCDLGDDCRYLADHVSAEVVEDALDGHRRRAHATLTDRSEDTTRTGWIPNWSFGTGAASRISESPGAPEWASVNAPQVGLSPSEAAEVERMFGQPSPRPREEQ